jgi:hypothetical protein
MMQDRRINMRITQKLLLWINLLVLNVVVFAQDKDVDINIRTEGESGFFAGNAFWLLLLVGVIVLLIIGMSLRGRSHTHVEQASHHHHE